MGSPAEAYAERQWEERHATKVKENSLRYEAIIALRRSVGFGSEKEGDWVEREICRHLEAVQNLLQLQKASLSQKG